MGFIYLFDFLICEGLVSLLERVCQGCDLLGGRIHRELGQLPLMSFWRRAFCQWISQGSVSCYTLVARGVYLYRCVCHGYIGWGVGHVLTASGDGWWWSLLVADQLEGYVESVL